MPKSALPDVPLLHINSHIDTSVVQTTPTVVAQRMVAGYTEWGAHWDTAEAYISWNWAVVMGSIIVLDPAAIRTNILLVEEGSALSRLLNKAHIYELIESLPWRSVVEDVVARVR